MQSTSATFSCHKCGTPYPWAPEIVGKTAKCRCGAILKVPAALPGSEAANQEVTCQQPNPGCLLPQDSQGGDDVVNAVFAPPPPPGSAPALEKNPNQKLPTAEESIIAMMGQLPPSAAKRVAPMEVPDEELDSKTEAELKELAQYGENDEHKPNDYLDFKLPLILLGVGLLLMFGEALYSAGRHGGSLIGAVIGVILVLVLNVVLITVGLLIAARFFGMNFGAVGTAILKIAAIYAAPSTLGGLVTTTLGGSMAVSILGGAVSVVLYWALLSYLFRLDGSQTMICAVCIGLVRMLTTMLLVGAMLGALGASIDADAKESMEEVDESLNSLAE
jgi:hypothetical protein